MSEKRHLESEPATPTPLYEIPLMAAKKLVSDAFTRMYLVDVFRRSGGNVSQAARLASIDRANLKRLVRQVFGKAKMPETPAPELWRPVVGFEGRYSVSSHGSVRRIKDEKIVHTGCKTRANNYCVVTLHDGKKRRTFAVHKIVTEAFLGTAAGRQVNHRDGNRSNNCLQNLEYVTPRENTVHGFGLLDSKADIAAINDAIARAERGEEGYEHYGKTIPKSVATQPRPSSRR